MTASLGLGLIVNATGDDADAKPGDGLCQTVDKNCTLRAAIEEANALRGTNNIIFDIPGTAPHTILPKSPLPTITEAVTIDGRTQPDYKDTPTIVLNGSQAGEQASGLTITAGDSIVRGLAIHSFDYSGIYLLGGANNRIEHNYLGTTGKLAQGNQIGILVEKSSLNSIGGKEAGNLISGNEIGVYFYGLGTSENTVAGNLIGTDANGTAPLGNQYGIRITAADGTLIGGNNAADRNVIAGNGTGVYIQGKGASGNRVWGNYIGLDITGQTILENEDTGVYILDAPGNQVGGPNERGNVIAGGELGVYVRGQASKGNLVRNNLIGMDASQKQPVRRLSGGVLVVEADNTLIGGTKEDDGNHIVSHQFGIRVQGTAVDSTTADNNILDVLDDEPEDEREDDNNEPTDTLSSLPTANNQTALIWMPEGRRPRSEYVSSKVGEHALFQSGTTFTVNSTGDGGDANIGNGICADSSGNCTLRAAIQEANDTTALDTIAFNIPGSGPHTIQPDSELPVIYKAVTIDGTTEPNFVSSPIIELDGSNAGAGADGLNVQVDNCTIRGLVINRFDDDGIMLDNEASNTLIEGNYIGTDVNGTADLGNLGNGIILWKTPNVTIGGTTTAARNLISGNAQNGIGIFTEDADNNVIQGNIIGLDINGTTDLGNGYRGIYILNGGDNNTIGGTTANAGNIISGNDGNGIELETDTDGNVIQGNLIGINASGTAALGNGNRGIEIDDAASNIVGGTTAAARNIISGNNDDGITLLYDEATDNLIQGNYIGTNINGTAALGNSSDGIYVFGGAYDNIIGGTAAGAGNLISGNGDEGIQLYRDVTSNLIQGNLIGTDVSGTSDLGNIDRGIEIYDAYTNTIGGPTAAARNIISGNNDDGIGLQGATTTGNLIQGNFIGTNISGTAALGNSNDGIVAFNNSGNNTIGGTITGTGNLISGNGDDGIDFESTTAGSLIQGNLIGTDVSGMVDIGNIDRGIQLDDSPNNIIGGTTAAARNVISGNNDNGIALLYGETTGNLIQGNYIGTNIDGTAALANSSDGIMVYGGVGNNTIGGTVAGAGNLISGNGAYGILFNENTADMVIQGNYIGTNAAGTAAIGNGKVGIALNDASNNTIGGTASGAGNLISGNGEHGISMWDAGSTGNVIQGNLIGTAADGVSDLGNGRRGVSIYPNGPDDNMVGGVVTGAGNVIAFNNEQGVYVDSGGVENTIRANSIFSNTNLGIDLAYVGVTSNDSGDPDTGANLRQNYPVLNGAVTSSSSTTISGTLNSTANLTFTLDFYGNTTCDPNGYGEGQFYLGSDTVTTDGNGNVSFTSPLSTGAVNNPILTATATDPNGNTSEFSACITATIIAVGDDPIAGLEAFNNGPTTLGNSTLLWVSITAGTGVTYAWDFDDNTSGSGDTVYHTYPSAGIFTATITATNSVNQMTATTIVTVNEAGGNASQTWWNDDFFYRRQLSLTTAIPITGDDATFNTVAVTLNDTDDLITAGKLQEDGRDLRLAYWDDVSWSILPVQISPIISPTAVTTFALQAPITDTNNSYWLYYGNAVAGNGPEMSAPELTENHIITNVVGTSVVTPTVNFYADSRQIWEPGTITFTSEVTPSVASHTWDFGDGITLTEQLTQTNHTYMMAGIYTVTLTVVTTDSMEVTLGYADYISVLSSRNEDVTINIGPEEIPVVTETVFLGGGAQSLVSAQGDLQVTFPEAAITQTLVITHTPFQATVAQDGDNLNRFDLTAVDAATGAPVTQFVQPLTLALDITQYNLTSEEADTLLFFYWDETAIQWQPITTTVDFAQGKAWSEMDHFTEIVAATNYGLGTPALRRLPSISDGGVDLLTGASTYVYPLEVPPGTHGMQPNLSLVYNSGAAGTLLDQQAGLVGHGFELAGLGWIQKDLNTGDYYLNLNGVSEKLIQNGTSSFYHTEHPTFWQIEQATGGQNGTGKFWQVTMQDGIQYQFGFSSQSTSVLPHVEGVQGIVYRFNLDQVQDVYSNTITIVYDEQTLTKEEPGYPYPYTVATDMAAWPVRIEYTSNGIAGLSSTRVISFTYDQPDSGMVNWDGWRADYSGPYTVYEAGPGSAYGYQEALKEIQMLVDGQQVRTYMFDYQYYTSNGDSPSQYGPGNYHLMLEQIRENGTDSQGLPPTNLIYADTGHLQSISNGYGGEVGYLYEKIEENMVANYEGEDFDSDSPDTDRWRVITRTITDTIASQTHDFSYEYEGAVFKEGSFQGHQLVTVTTPEGDETRTFFSLGEYNLSLDARLNSKYVPWGKPYRIEIWDSGTNLLSSTRFSYHESEELIKCSLSTIGAAPSLRTCYDYDVYGNVIRVDNNNRITHITYLSPPANRYISNLPDEITRTYGNGTTILAKTDYEYSFYPNNYTAESLTVTQPDLSSAAGPSLVTYQHFDSIGNVDKNWMGTDQYTTTITYDPTYLTFPVVITHANGLIENYEYDARFGVVTETIDIDNVTTTYGYDSFGRLASEDGTNGQVSYTYDDSLNGLLVNVNAFGQPDYLVQSYNGLGQLTQEVQSGQITTAYQYDSQGRLIMSTLPYTNTASRRELNSTYDALGRPLNVATRDSITNTIHYSYPNWQTVNATDVQGLTTVYALDAFGRVRSVTEGGNLTTYQYVDYSLNPSLRITDTIGNQTIIHYDSLGRKVAMDDPDMGTWAYAYDERGYLAVQTDARGISTTLGYDALGRVITTTYNVPTGTLVADTAQVRFDYSAGRTQMWDGSGSTIWTYDADGRLQAETKNIGVHTFVTGYDYDDYGRLQTMTYPDGEEVTYDYNTLNQVIQVTGQDIYLSDAIYDPLGQPTIWALGGVVTQTIGYTPLTFRPATVSAVNLGAQVLQDLALNHDNLGRLDWWADNSQGSTQWLNPEYDNLNRLDEIGSNILSFQQNYVYDSLGNLTDRDGLGLTYNVVDRPHLPGEDSDGTIYDYDENGNMVSRTLSSGTTISYTYDAENRLTQVISYTETTSQNTNLMYDGGGNLVKRLSPSGESSIYLGDYVKVQLDSGSVGTTVSAPENISASQADSLYPCIAVDSSDSSYVVWEENGEIYFSRNAGSIVNISNTSGSSKFPSVAVQEGIGQTIIHVTWEDWTNGYPDIYYSYSDDYGNSWSVPIAVSGSGSYSDLKPQIAVATDGKIHIVWEAQQTYSPFPYEIYHRWSNDRDDWSTSPIINISGTLSEANMLHTDITAGPNGDVYVVWGGGSNPATLKEGEVFFRRWSGSSWETEIPRISDGSNKSVHPTISVDGNGEIHVAWHNAGDDTSSIAGEIEYVSGEFQLGSIVWSSIEQLTDGQEKAFINPDIAADENGTVHLSWIYDGALVYSQRYLGTWSQPITISPAASTMLLGPTSVCGIASGAASSAHLAFDDLRNNQRDVFYVSLQSQSYAMVKWYYANGQQVTTRVDDGTLYYHLNDPTGTSLVMVDANGDEAGRMVYDGFGAVLTNTLPLTLTGTIPDTPDAATGLVHLGGGRWYDPALGRPLQPNAVGGLPTLPQALNRYAATPLGQPGVYQAAANGGSLGANLRDSSISNSISAAIGNNGIEPLAVNLIESVRPWYLMSISTVASQRGSRGLLSRLLNEGATDYSVARRLADGRLSDFRGLVFTHANVDDLARRLGSRGFNISSRSLGQHAGRIWSFGPNHLTVGNIVSGFGADLFVGGVWQGVSDAINYPGLWTNDRDLAIRRIEAASVSSAINGTIGGTIGAGIALGVYALYQVSPVGWVVTGASIIGATLFEVSPWGQNISHTIFDAFDTDIDRSLRPLIMP